MAASYRDRYTPRPVTDVFTSDTDIDRRQCKRKVPMKVLILGLGRTGTACASSPPAINPPISNFICQLEAQITNYDF